MSVDFRFDRNDYGIIFYGTSAAGPLPTYVDYLGKTRTAVELNSAVEAFMPDAYESAYFHVGSAAAFSLECETSVISGATADLVLYAEAEPGVAVDSSSPVLLTVSNVTGLGAASQPLTDGKIMLQTDNLTTLSTGAIGITPTIGEGGGITVIVRLRVL